MSCPHEAFQDLQYSPSGFFLSKKCHILYNHCGKNICIAKYLLFYTRQKLTYLILTKNEQKQGNYFSRFFPISLA